MAETLRELVVTLSLDSSNFSRNMRSINQQIGIPEDLPSCSKEICSYETG